MVFPVFKNEQKKKKNCFISFIFFVNIERVIARKTKYNKAREMII